MKNKIKEFEKLLQEIDERFYEELDEAVEKHIQTKDY